MKRTLMGILFFILQITHFSYATTYHTFVPGLTIDYELPVNDPQVFSNIFFWPIKATCKVISSSEINPLSVTMLNKSGSVNNTILTKGDSILLMLHAGDKFNVTADSGAKVQLINQGDQTIKASCAPL